MMIGRICCKNCGAESYTGEKTQLACGKCYDTLRALLRLCGEALEAGEYFIAIKKEHYRQCDLGKPPSEGWSLISFQDVVAIRLKRDRLRQAALTALHQAGIVGEEGDDG